MSILQLQRTKSPTSHTQERSLKIHECSLVISYVAKTLPHKCLITGQPSVHGFYLMLDPFVKKSLIYGSNDPRIAHARRTLMTFSDSYWRKARKLNAPEWSAICTRFSRLQSSLLQIQQVTETKLKYWAFIPRVYDRNVPILLESFVEKNASSEQKSSDDDADHEMAVDMESHDLQTQEEIQVDFNSMCDDVLSRLFDREKDTREDEEEEEEEEDEEEEGVNE